MTDELKAHDFPEVYKWLGINLNQLGCVMLPLMLFPQPMDLPLYKSPNPERFWIDGWVAEKKAHVTLLYGLLTKARNLEPHIKEVLGDWSLDEILIDVVDYFPSPYQDEKYWCIVARLLTTPKLVEAHRRLEFLPHINTFTEYKPHMTLGYIEHVSEKERDDLIHQLNLLLEGKPIKVTGGIDLGRP